MHYFQTMSSPSGVFAPRPPPGLQTWTSMLLNADHCFSIICLLIHVYSLSGRSRRWTEKVEHVQQCITRIHDYAGRRSAFPHVQLFISSKSGILNIAIFKYSWRKFNITTSDYTQKSTNYFKAQKLTEFDTL